MIIRLSLASLRIEIDRNLSFLLISFFTFIYFSSYLRGHSANGVNVIASADEVWCVELQLTFAQPFNNSLWGLGEKIRGSGSLSQSHPPLGIMGYGYVLAVSALSSLLRALLVSDCLRSRRSDKWTYLRISLHRCRFNWSLLPNQVMDITAGFNFHTL